MNKSSVGVSVTSTPINKRLNPAHVTLDRPRRRLTSGPSQLSAHQDTSTDLATSTGSKTTLRSPASSPTVLPLATTDRIPSLTRSEVSAPETSVGTTTPEAPSRRVAVLTPRSEGHSRSRGQDDLSQERSEEHEWHQDNERIDEHTGEGRSEIVDSQIERDQSQEMSQSYDSRAKLGASLSYAQFSTPGVGRDSPSGTTSPRSMSNLGGAGMISSFHDKTPGNSHVPYVPFTPTPAGLQSHYGNLTTPRAPLDDAERRKSHVLAVLGSSGIPARTPRSAYKGTPHPLRRVSVAPLSESITEEGASGSQRASTATPGGRTFLSAGDSGMQSVNDSFVSIASSADLTSDKRASHFPSRVSRGNTSFPNILLPGSASQNSPGGSLRGVSDQRANGVKIHKHLNAMNKQLLETNADLAREAEAWRDEVERLKGVLSDAGVEVEEVDVLGQLPERSQADISLVSISRRNRYDTPADSSLGGPAKMERSHSAPLDGEHEHTAILHEMTEKLEGLEEMLAEKDEIIADLEQRLETAGGDQPLPKNEEAQQQIDGLNRQLDEAEQLREQLHSDFAQKTEQHAQRFGEICTGFEEQVKSLEGQLESSRNESERLRADKARLEDLASAASRDEREREWRKQVTGLEVDLGRAKEEARTKAAEVDSLHKEVEQRRTERAGLEQQLATTHSELTRLTAQREQIDQTEAERDQELQNARTSREQLEQELTAAHDEIDNLRREVSERQGELEHNQEEIKELVDQLNVLEQRDTSQHIDDEEIQRLNGIIEETDTALADREAELEQLRAKVQTMELRHSTVPSPGREQNEDESLVKDNANESFIATLEQRLDEAHHTIGRLQHELNATPRRNGVIEVREARIRALESEKAALTERLAAKESSILATNSLQGAVSPFKASPFVHKAIASLKTPKTPGPLKEVSSQVS